MITSQQVISIGRITRTHGKRGEIQCLTSNEYWDNADATFLILNIDNILVPFRVLDWRGKGRQGLQERTDNDEDSACTCVLHTPAWRQRLVLDKHPG